MCKLKMRIARIGNDVPIIGRPYENNFIALSILAFLEHAKSFEEENPVIVQHQAEIAVSCSIDSQRARYYIIPDVSVSHDEHRRCT